MDDVSMLPKITAKLLEMNYSEQDVKNILGENILRLLERVDAIGKEIRAGAAGKAGSAGGAGKAGPAGKAGGAGNAAPAGKAGSAGR